MKILNILRPFWQEYLWECQQAFSFFFVFFICISDWLQPSSVPVFVFSSYLPCNHVALWFSLKCFLCQAAFSSHTWQHNKGMQQLFLKVVERDWHDSKQIWLGGNKYSWCCCDSCCPPTQSFAPQKRWLGTHRIRSICHSSSILMEKTQIKPRHCNKIIQQYQY